MLPASLIALLHLQGQNEKMIGFIHFQKHFKIKRRPIDKISLSAPMLLIGSLIGILNHYEFRPILSIENRF